MPNFAPIQPSFAGGETSPEFAGRVDSDLYRTALAYCRNWMVMPQGPLVRRAGTEYVRKLDGLPRLFDFRGVNGRNHLLALGAGVANIHYDNGAPVVVESTDLIKNGTFDGAAEWTGVARGGYLIYDYGGVALKVLGSLERPYVYQKVTLNAPARLTVRAKMWLHGDPDEPGWFDVVHILELGTVANVPDIMYREFNLKYHTPKGGPYYFEAQTEELPAGDYYITMTVKERKEDDDAPEAVFDDVQVLMSEPEAGIAVPWTDAQLEQVQMGYEAGGPQSLFAHPNVPPWFLKNPAAGQWDHGDLVFSDPPHVNPDDAGSALAWLADHWPSTVEVFNGRAYWGGLPTELNRLWATKVGSVTNLLVGTDPDDAIDQKLAVKGSIRWFCGKRALLMGTDVGEHVVTGSTGVPAPGDTRLQDESAFGSAPVQARHLGDEVVYVTRDRRDVRAVSFDNDENAWISRTLAFFARHMTAGGVKEVHFARSPFPCILLVLYGGGLVACTYARREKVTAWWRIEVGAPVHSVAVIETDNGSDVWLAVRREQSSKDHPVYGKIQFVVENSVYLERLPLHEIGAQHLDCWTYASGATLYAPHLAGMQVAVLETGIAGMAWDGKTYTVEGDGTVAGFAPEDPETIYVVGLPYSAKATTLPVEGVNPAGTSQGMKVHYSEITARIYNSARPLVSVAGTAPEKRGRAGSGRPFSTPADAAEAPFTGDVLVKNMTVARGGAIDIEADMPFRTEVCAIFGHASAPGGTL